MTRGRMGSDHGFNLIELMMVVVILGIVVGIAFVSYAYSVERSRSIACESNQRTLGDAAISYQAKHGRPIDELDDLRPHVRGFDSAATCPSDGTVHLQWNPDELEITCALHP